MKIIAILVVFAMCGGAYAKPAGSPVAYDFDEDSGDFTVFKKNSVDFIDNILVRMLARQNFSDILLNMEMLRSVLDKMKDIFTNYPAIANFVNTIFTALNNLNKGKDMRPTIYVAFKLLERAIQAAEGMCQFI